MVRPVMAPFALANREVDVDTWRRRTRRDRRAQAMPVLAIINEPSRRAGHRRRLFDTKRVGEEGTVMAIGLAPESRKLRYSPGPTRVRICRRRDGYEQWRRVAETLGGSGLHDLPLLQRLADAPGDPGIG